jgi:hypothetical protein
MTITLNSVAVSKGIYKYVTRLLHLVVAVNAVILLWVGGVI